MRHTKRWEFPQTGQRLMDKEIVLKVVAAKLEANLGNRITIELANGILNAVAGELHEGSEDGEQPELGPKMVPDAA